MTSDFVCVFVVWVNLGVFLGGMSCYGRFGSWVLCFSFGEKLYQIINVFAEAETFKVADN